MVTTLQSIRAVRIVLPIVAMLAACAAPVPGDDDDDGPVDGKEDAAGAVLCDPLPEASSELCKLIPNNGWRTALRDELTQPYFEPLAVAVAKARAIDAASDAIEDDVYPPADATFAALRYVSPGRVKAVIVGQDPYINAGQAVGLSFSVAPGIDVPPSLDNIYTELVREAADPALAADLPNGFVCPGDGDLTSWAKHGVFLLNSILTVRHGEPGSHASFGWQHLTDAILRVARDRNAARPTVYLLWGAYARAAASLIQEHGDNPNILVLQSAHPSPLTTGFVGNGHFAATNAFLVDHGRTPIDWSLPPPSPTATNAPGCHGR